MFRFLLLCTALLLPFPGHSETLDITIVSSTAAESGDAGQSFAGITVKPWRPVRRAVELALFESSTLFETLEIQSSIHQLELDPAKDIPGQLAGAVPESLFILDLPLSIMEPVARAADQLGLIAVNVRHSDTRLRETLCLPGLLHTIPSDRMYFDALGQFLIYRGWRRVLVIKGPSDRDTDRARTLLESLERLGANIVDIRTFTLSHHPDDRDENKPEFITGGASYDVVAVIDSVRDYGRYLQYSTRSARPVVGDVGLIPTSWHYALERYGAPQLNERYRTFKDDMQADSRVSMTDTEFAAWSAVKLITNSINSRQSDTEFDLMAILQDPASQVDLYKGTRGSVRHWNNQLRQPILLSTMDAVIAVAPMPKFLHPKHYVDTLGIDEPESECRLRQP